MYVPLQVNRFDESVLLIVQYFFNLRLKIERHPVQIFKIMFRRFYSPESDPPHEIMRYWFYYSIWLAFSFPTDHAGLVEMVFTTVVPVSKGHLGGASP